jgi:ABC-type nickel/cobalt efflux system permease component RcnA
MSPQLLLIAAVAAVGVLHTIVPDHWLPISLMARQEGWARRETARAACGAGLGHSLSTLTIGLLVWLGGTALAARLGHAVSGVASAALIGFGLWIAIASWRELRREAASHGHPHGHEEPHHSHIEGDPDSQPSLGHRHPHHHHDGRHHAHYHRHSPASWHTLEGALALAPTPHEHDHRLAPRRALLLILGSSPMVEGLPAFFAAGRFGLALLAVMAVVFTLSTTATYVVLCLSSTAGLQRADFGPLERFGEVLSGAFIALVGVVFLLWTGM